MTMTTFREYQRRAHETSHNTEIGGNALLYPVLGLVGESGELANKIKKIYRDNDGQMGGVHHDRLVEETGDILWYVSEICTQLGVALEYVAAVNLRKLADRAERGVIGGSGDNR